VVVSDSVLWRGQLTSKGLSQGMTAMATLGPAWLIELYIIVCLVCVVQGVPGYARDSGGHARVHDQVYTPCESTVTAAEHI
jgi:hypothetical protein